MTAAVLFGILSAFFLILTTFLLDLFLFYLRYQRLLCREKMDKVLLKRLEARHKKTKHPIKKNLFLYWSILVLLELGEGEKATGLLPFLKDDALMGIKKEGIRI
ncbi:MAG: hypothetical protein IKC69_04380 [Clostridia bacterium]|nr:hypothetical protein [Clostridia bacterium]